MTPADSDLRDFRFMPLDVVRFAQSDLVALEDPAAVLAAILLWGASWHALPAGSLTDDDRALARLAGYGRGGSEWEAVRQGAMRGWAKCADGRLYHPVVAEKVVEAWTGRLKLRHRTYCATIRKHNERNPDAKLIAPLFEDWEAAGRPDRVTRDETVLSRVTDGDVTRAEPALSRASHGQNRSKRQGTGDRGQGNNNNPSGGAAKRGTRLPSDFAIPDEWITWASTDGGLARQEAIRQGALFVDHWAPKSGSAGTKLDWLATWRNWVRRSPQFERAGRQARGREYLGI